MSVGSCCMGLVHGLPCTPWWAYTLGGGGGDGRVFCVARPYYVAWQMQMCVCVCVCVCNFCAPVPAERHLLPLNMLCLV